MTTETTFPGKDAALDTTIATLRATLARRRFRLAESPPTREVDGIWSIELQDVDCPLLSAHGRGATELAARASAYGAFAERLGTHDFWTHYHLGAQRANAPFVHHPSERWFAPAADGSWPSELLDPELHAFYNPRGDIDAGVLVDINSGNVARGICALPYQRLRDGATAYIPVNLIGNLYVSNGTAAGNTVNEARVQALSEIFERAIKYRVIAEGMCLPEVPDDVVARFPAIAAGIAGLRRAGFGVLVKDASLGGKYPVMNVTLIQPKDQGVLSSFGAHPRLEIALERALTALLRGRSLGALDGYPEPSFDASEIDAVANLEAHFVDARGVIAWDFLSDTSDYPFVDWNFGGTTVEDYLWLVDALHAEGKDIYVADFDAQGVHTCRILVPGLSEIYPVEDLEWENNSVGNALRPLLVRLQDLSVQECTALLVELQTSNLNDERPLWEILGLAAAAGTPWKQLRIGELKTLLALVVGDEEAVLEGCNWIHHYGDLAKPRRLVYRCIESLVRLEEPDNFRRALELLYGAETLAMAEALLDGSERFFGLEPLGPNFEGSPLHQSLLAAYDKLFAPDAV
ncbi:ribosomal protein S12 methylthiotransferase accessory factor [Duganella sp. CF517]|uniref:30S ribosomal protein S12 methylthiotransferase accessory factor YcaO n=1 Tax=Duganella sp. CF517 TaxID=1881038 RepID=UPI0008B30A3A|nr:30S ribosomal protein S12 methylthiotransferase accessory factor YcaO [Duganella sp. CF517]SEN33736.1 ribosomal protein S12 methylthiotransferase accessory factor [Duganella sp. CF517]